MEMFDRNTKIYIQACSLELIITLFCNGQQGEAGYTNYSRDVPWNITQLLTGLPLAQKPPLCKSEKDNPSSV